MKTKIRKPLFEPCIGGYRARYCTSEGEPITLEMSASPSGNYVSVSIFTRDGEDKSSALFLFPSFFKTYRAALYSIISTAHYQHWYRADCPTALMMIPSVTRMKYVKIMADTARKTA